MEVFINLSRIQCTQAITFDMLCEFDKLCKSEGYAYSLAGGTLLGAIRHKDMIPWDDDIDLFMLREDYERFLEKYAGKSFSNPYYKIINIDSGFEGQTFTRMIDTRTRTTSKQSVTFRNLWIDILPVDEVPDDFAKRVLFQREMRRLRRWRVLFNLPPWSGKSFLVKLKKTPVGILARWFGWHNKVCKKIIKTAQKYRNAKNANEVAEIVAQGWVKGTMCKETFAQSVEVELRGKMFPAMPDYNHYLTGQFGNYLTLPPKNERKAHKLNIKIDITKYDGALREELLYYIKKKDIEEQNLQRLEEQREAEALMEAEQENFTDNNVAFQN